MTYKVYSIVGQSAPVHMCRYCVRPCESESRISLISISVVLLIWLSLPFLKGYLLGKSSPRS